MQISISCADFFLYSFARTQIKIPHKIFLSNAHGYISTQDFSIKCAWVPVLSIVAPCSPRREMMASYMYLYVVCVLSESNVNTKGT